MASSSPEGLKRDAKPRFVGAVAGIGSGQLRDSFPFQSSLNRREETNDRVSDESELCRHDVGLTKVAVGHG